MSAPSLAGFTWDPEPDETLKGLDSQCLFSTDRAEEHPKPDWTIAVPTFRRPALLIHTLQSVIEQTDLHDVELLVVDNDPETTGLKALLEALPALQNMAFRYHRNRSNIGMFGNWNACLALARGRWVTILNDDDLLDPTFIASMRAIARDDPTVDAITCSYRFLDCRPGAGSGTSVPARERVRNIFRFGAKTRRRISVRDMFFGSITGSSLGLVVRREVAMEIGGFRSAEYPSADFYFAARLARRYCLVQSRNALAVTRIAENESARADTLIGFIRCQGDLQDALLGREAPAWWHVFQAPALHMAMTQLSRFWKVSLNKAEIEHITNRRLSPRGAGATRIFRLLIGAI